MAMDLADSSLVEYNKTIPAFGFSFGGAPAPVAMVKDILAKFPTAVL